MWHVRDKQLKINALFILKNIGITPFRTLPGVLRINGTKIDQLITAKIRT